MMRAAALIIEADHVALIERRNTSSLLPYYLFPDGHIEIGETPPETVIREIWEELGRTDRCAAARRGGAVSR